MNKAGSRSHRPAAPDTGLAPYPGTVIVAHLRFCSVDGAEKLPFSRSSEKRAHDRIFSRVGVEELDGRKSGKLARPQPVAPHPGAVRPACRKMPEDIHPAVGQPLEQVFRSRGDRIPENPAAQPALHAGLLFVRVHICINRFRFRPDKGVPGPVIEDHIDQKRVGSPP